MCCRCPQFTSVAPSLTHFVIGRDADPTALTANEESRLAWLGVLLLNVYLRQKLVSFIHKSNMKQSRTPFVLSFKATTKCAKDDESENNDFLEMETPNRIGDVCEAVDFRKDVDTDSEFELGRGSA